MHQDGRPCPGVGNHWWQVDSTTLVQMESAGADVSAGALVYVWCLVFGLWLVLSGCTKLCMGSGDYGESVDGRIWQQSN